jgi:7-cyano-7-deazaguanine synthase
MMKTTSNPSAVIIYSGGSDSYTLLHYLRAQKYRIDRALSFNYGQRHKKELQFAAAECKRLNIPHTILDLRMLGDLVGASSSLVKSADSPEVPHGFYAAENMKLTVVPNRNMVMLSLATAYAAAHKIDVVAYGAHAGDHDIYPDCREEFIAAMAHAISLCDWTPPRLIAPFHDRTKASIYSWGLWSYGLDYSRAWTCYEGKQLACGQCGSCVERLHAFAQIHGTDPLKYADRDYWRTVVPGDAQ